MNSYIDELRELAKLKEDGIITEEEFQKKKEELLSESSNTEKTEIKSTLWICESCKKEIEEQFDACWNCGSVKSGNRKSNDKNDKISSDLSTLSETVDEKIEANKDVKENNKNNSKNLKIILGVFGLFFLLLIFLINVSGDTDSRDTYEDEVEVNEDEVEVTFEADSKRLSIHEIKQLAEKYINSSSQLHGYMGMDYYSNLSNPDKGLFSFYVAVCYGSSKNNCSYENVYLYTKNYGATWLIDFQ